jgi:hypothetical protein
MNHRDIVKLCDLDNLVLGELDGQRLL